MTPDRLLSFKSPTVKEDVEGNLGGLVGFLLYCSRGRQLMTL